MHMDHSILGIIVMSWIMVAVAVISVTLRFWSRATVLKGKYWWDDWLSLFSTVFALALLGIGLSLPGHGFGKHLETLMMPQIKALLLGFWISTFLFEASLAFAKLSMLAFYLRVFGPWKSSRQSWKLSFCTVAFITLGWPTYAFPFTTFICVPVRKSWNPEIPGHCLSQRANLLSGACTNAITDFLILVLPLPQVFSLNMSTKKKITATAIFLAATSIPLLSVGRAITVSEVGDAVTGDFSYSVVPITFFLVSEPSLSVMATSVPAIFQLINRARRNGVRALFNSRDYELVKRTAAARPYHMHAKRETGSPNGSSRHGFLRPDLGSNATWSTVDGATDNRLRKDSQTESEMSEYKKQILVTTDFDMELGAGRLRDHQTVDSHAT